MKNFLLLAYLLSVADAALAQGTVSFVNAAATRINTNAIASGGGSGLTATAANGFYYALLTAPYETTNSDLASGLWTFTGLYATNTTVPGRLNGNNNVATLTG